MKEHFLYKYDDLFNPVLRALHNLGGSGSTNEIEEQVIETLKLTEKQASEIHRGNTSKLSYRLAWARNYLKRYGLLENSARKIWRLTEIGRKLESVDQELVKRNVKAEKLPSNIDGENNEPEEVQTFSWHDLIIEQLLKIQPDAFERLCRLMLRELGFINVEVLGKTNDGGIDGKGILKVGAVLSFYIVFQAKRHKGSISSDVIRNLRGAMSGRTADRGLVITTGTFTREAKKEAAREGASPIELLDGRDLAEKLKELKMGVETKLVEKVNINPGWFQNI